MYNNVYPTSSVYFAVSLTVTSNNGCKSTLTKNNYIAVYPQPRAAFSYGSDDGSMLDVLNNTVHFYTQAQGASVYHYNLGDEFANPQSVNLTTNPNPIHQYAYSEPYSYLVTQEVENQYGCKDSTSQTIVIHPVFTFFVPSSFSPNGDGINEYFKGSGIGIDNSTYSMYVYDRWGNSVFKSNDLEKAWDGRINNKGEIVMEDVFVWKAKFKDTTGQSHEYHGTVSIVK